MPDKLYELYYQSQAKQVFFIHVFKKNVDTIYSKYTIRKLFC